MFTFTHALRHSDTGLFYTGEAGETWVASPSLDHPPFTFTLIGAEKKANSLYNSGHFFDIVPTDSISWGK